jgi:diguanylate cyclase (GGDEF)-like protein/PAS domain S-box-containing protein
MGSSDAMNSYSGELVPRSKILLVDDLPDILLFLTKLLSKLGVEVYSAGSGNEALTLTLQHEFAVILLDVHMPGMNGYEVARLLREEERTRDVPIIFVTGAYEDELHRLKGYEAGAVDYIEKPINEIVLLSKVRVLVDLQHSLRLIETTNQRLNREIGVRKKSEEDGRRLADTVFASSTEGIVVTDRDVNVIAANPAFVAVTGYEADEIVGKNPRMLKSGRHDKTFYEAMWQQLTATGHWQGEIWNKRKNGEIYPEWLSISAIRAADGSVDRYVAIFSDITERKEAENEQWRLSRALRLLSDCNLALVHAEDERTLLSDVCRLVVETGGYLMSWIGLAEHDIEKSVRPVAQFGHVDGFLESIRVSWDEALDIGSGSTGTAIRTGKAKVITDYLTNPDAAPWREAVLKRGYQSGIAVPLISRRQPIGALAIYSAKPDDFRAEEVALLEELARNLGFGIEALRTRSLIKTAQAELAIAAIAFNSQEGTVISDPTGTILRINPAFTNITGYTPEEAVGGKTNLLKSGRHDAAFYAAMWESITRDGSWQGEIWNRRKNGEVYPEWLTITAVKGEDGTTTHYVGTFNDITERKEAEDRIKELAFYDALTHLPNRRLLADRLRQALAASVRSKREGALLFIDLDNFKTVNDTQGHDTGDLLLQEVARRLVGIFREADTVARFGGDEFVVVLADLSANPEEAAAQARIVGEKILTALGEPYQISTQAFRCTPSVGITLFGNRHGGTDDLMKQADIAMYQAKDAGRNTLRFFDPELQSAMMERTSLEADLHKAIEEEQFLLYYQAQIIGEGRLTGAEALVRWLHPKRGMVSPGAFIPLAEETGLILPLGRWVLETACRQLTEWANRPEMADLTVAVNVSARQFRQPDFVDEVLAVLRSTGADPRRLKLELTESLLVENVKDIVEKMSALKSNGVGFSLDDFGTGYSSLSYLKRLPLDQLKIDQSFVRDILVDPNDATIARTIVALAQSFGISVIAEGVETAAQRAFLASLGCQAYQGYFFSRPLPLEGFELFARQAGAMVADGEAEESAEDGPVPVEVDLLRRAQPAVTALRSFLR